MSDALLVVLSLGISLKPLSTVRTHFAGVVFMPFFGILDISRPLVLVVLTHLRKRSVVGVGVSQVHNDRFVASTDVPRLEHKLVLCADDFHVLHQYL